MSACLGIDLGTTNTKVALVMLGISGQHGMSGQLGMSGLDVRAVASAPTPGPSALKGVLLALIREVLAASPPPPGGIGAVGIASMAETGVPLDDAGTPLGPWVRWNAHHAGAEADALAARLGWAELVAATGVRPSAKVPLATWAWLRANRPDLWRATARWAGVADLAAFLLTGRLTTDHTLAGRTMAYRLPGDLSGAAAGLPQSFDADLLAEVGLRPEQLPSVGGPPAGVTDTDFVHCGLRAGTPVVVAGHDHAVGAYACGVREPGDVADSIGTAEAVMTVVAGVPDPVAVGRAGMSTVVTVGGRHRAVLAGSSSAGAVLARWLEGGAAVFDDLPPDPTGVLVLPYLQGRQTPAPDPAAGFRIVGREPSHGPAVLAKATLEGLCLHTRWMLAEQARLAGPGKTVFLFGGAVAANPAWTRIKTQVLPGTVRVVPAVEPVAAGAALLAAVRAGHVEPPGPALAAEAAPSAPPGPETSYDDMYTRFVAAAQEQT